MSSSDTARLDDSARRIIIAAILIISLVGTGLSLMIPLLSLELERMGASGTMNGVNTAVGGIANIVAAPLVPALAGRFGQARLLVATVLLLAVTILMFRLVPTIPAWFLFRFSFGMSIGTLFVLSEFWITVSAPEARRGVIMGIYATVLATGFAAGPALLALTGTAGWPPYLACAGLMLLALTPLALTRHGMPPIAGSPHPRLGPMLRIAPVATLAALMFGALETGSFSQFPIYGLRRGLEEPAAALLVTWMALGNLIFQIPIGWLSDRMDRRRVLLACTLAGATCAALMPAMPIGAPGFVVLLLAFGGVTGAIYTVGLAHLGSRFSGSDVAAANAAFVMLYSAGMVAGPPVTGLAMDGLGRNGFPVALTLMLLSYAALVIWRMMHHPR